MYTRMPHAYWCKRNRNIFLSICDMYNIKTTTKIKRFGFFFSKKFFDWLIKWIHFSTRYILYETTNPIISHIPLTIPFIYIYVECCVCVCVYEGSLNDCHSNCTWRERSFSSSTVYAFIHLSIKIQWTHGRENGKSIYFYRYFVCHI